MQMSTAVFQLPMGSSVLIDAYGWDSGTRFGGLNGMIGLVTLGCFVVK